jgi:hypothetical protein
VQEKNRCLRILYLGWLREYRIVRWWSSDVSSMPNVVNEGKSRANTGFGTVEGVGHAIRLAILRGGRIKGHIETRVFLSRDLSSE